MLKFGKIILLASMSLATISCLRQTESISPVAEVRTMSQLQREAMMAAAIQASGNTDLSAASKVSIESNSKDPSLFYLNLKYNILNMDINEDSTISNSFELVGNSILKAFAQIFIRLIGGRTVEIGTVDLPIDNLKLDFNIIKSFKIKKVHIEYNKDFDASTGHKANFSFVKNFNLLRASGKNSTIISYEKSQNNCNQKCLNFDVVNGDLYDLIKNNSVIQLKPELKIIELPAVEELKLDGRIEMQIGLKLPF